MGKNFFNRDDRDTKFVLFEWLKITELLNYEAYKDFSREDFEMILQEAQKLCKEVLGPANQDGDREGCTYTDGEVSVPQSFHNCWKVMRENSWIALSSSPEFGGQGLPASLAGLVAEFFVAANMAFMTYPGLTIANARVIQHFGTDGDRNLFLEKMNAGVWTGTMCLTEADALGPRRTSFNPSQDQVDDVFCQVVISAGDKALTTLNFIYSRVF